MYDHNSSVYNNNCLKAPRNPKNDNRQTHFDQKFLNELHNEVTKNFTEKMKTNILDRGSGDAKSFIDFYDSIPEYDDINHLSSREFYKKLENLKEKQREFCDYVNQQFKIDNSSKDSTWIDPYKPPKIRIDERSLSAESKRKSSIKPFCATPIPKKLPYGKYLDDDNTSLSDKDVMMLKPPSRRSVRIETPSMPSSSNITPEPYFRSKSRANHKTEWDEFTLDDLCESIENTPVHLETKSAPSSPLKTKKIGVNTKDEYDGITIPKPFQMTVRDEENQIVEELFLKINKPPKEEKPQQFKAHDVPIESQIPLFDKIMEDQHRRSQKVKEKRKNELQAQMRPFSFTRRDEEIQELTKRFSKSLPCVYNDDVPLRIKKFKAKPIPKNLFSNYIYKKMHEDEFYRALQKKVRAEEMLKLASLPPSMAKREKSHPKFEMCPRSFRDLHMGNERDTPVRNSRKIPNYKMYHDKYERELEELKNEFISTSPRPFKLKSSRKRGRRHHYRISSANSKSSSETRTPSSLDMSSINRSNLAAILRIQSARNRLEMEMANKLEESKLKEEARWREKLMRKKPVWQTLTYSQEEDLAMRLQLKRDEEKLRNEEHRLRMELMLGRVNQQPTLFERQSQNKFPKTKEELVEQLHKEYKIRGPKSGFSDINNLNEVKDEAIQAVVDEHNSKNSDEIPEEVFENTSRRSSKETYVVSDEDKEQYEGSCEESNKSNNGH